MDKMDGMQGMTPLSAIAPDHHMASDSTMMMSHMTFFWGKNAEILFSGWPGRRSGMYALALIFVFVVAVLVEGLSHRQWISDDRQSVAVGLIQTAVHTARVGLAYLVMLAVMSFNVGVLIAAIVGHAVGFLVFGSRAFWQSPAPEKTYVDPLPCCT